VTNWACVCKDEFQTQWSPHRTSITALFYVPQGHYYIRKEEISNFTYYSFCVFEYGTQERLRNSFTKNHSASFM